MARGWESKSVESQVEDAKNAKEQKPKPDKKQDLELVRKREGIELSRRRIVRELEAATSPVRKTSLEHALKFLDEQLRALDEES